MIKKSFIVSSLLLLSACHRPTEIEPGICPSGDQVRVYFEEMMSTGKLRHISNGRIYELFSTVGDTTINPTATMTVTEIEPVYHPPVPEFFKDVCSYHIEDTGRSLTVGIGVRRSCHD